VIGVTSFAPKHWDVYARKMLESFSKHWPGEIIAYVDEIPDEDFPKVTYKLLRKVHGHDQFVSYCLTAGKDRPSKGDSIFTGRFHGGYSYTYDAVRFCHKVFAQFDAFKNGGKVFWIDADSVALDQITKKFLDGLFDGKCLAIFDRPGFYTETGFVGFDTEHPSFKKFLDEYIKVYQKGTLFTLEGWHDCYALDHAIKLSGCSYTNLGKEWKKGDKLEVMDDSTVGLYIKHFKGNQKWQS